MKSTIGIKQVTIVIGVAVLLLLSLVLWRQAFQADGDVLAFQRISNNYGGFGMDVSPGAAVGSAVADIGDLNGDGVRDLVVGAPGDDDGGTNRGAVYVLFLDQDGTIDDINGFGRGFKKISDTYGQFTATLDDNDAFGSSVASIGDVNGDGISDIAVGAITDDDLAADTGAVYILFMDQDGTVNDTTGFAKISGTSGSFSGTVGNGDQFGNAIAPLGDLNSDGVPDIAVGAEFDDDGATNAGAVYVLFLDNDGTLDASAGSSAAGWTKISKSTAAIASTILLRDQFGSGLANIGDFNSDGVVDLAVGAQADDLGGTSATGAIYLLYLDTDGTMDDVTPFIKIGEGLNGFTGALDNGDSFGKTITYLGDLNGDGVGDLAVGAPYDDDGVSDAGAVYLLFFDADGTLDDTTNHVKISSASGASNYCFSSTSRGGMAVVKMADYTGDGVVEIAVGATNVFLDSGRREGGLCLFHLDADGTLDDTDPVDLLNTDMNVGFGAPLNRQSQFGSDADVIGDLNNDGVEDLVVSAQREASVYILFMDEDGTLDDTTPWARINATDGGFGGSLTSNGYFGVGVAGIGDLNGDGVEDIAIGEYNANDGGTGRGAVWVMFLDEDGSLDATAGQSGAGYTKISDTSGDFTATMNDGYAFGSDIAMIGDVNGDGINDLAVGAIGDDGTSGSSISDRGAVYVLFMDTDGSVKDTNGYAKIAEQSVELGFVFPSGFNLGDSVTGIGDLNGDDIPDIAVGAPGDNDGAPDNGAVYIFFLEADGSPNDDDPYAKISDIDGDFTATFTAGAQFGTGVSSIGDLNGDGIRELLVASHVEDSAQGAVYILFMDQDGTVDDTVGYKKIQDVQASPVGYIGNSVSSAGDINGDGIDDLITGGHKNSDGSLSEGGAYVLFLEGTALPPDSTAPTPGSAGTLTKTGDTETTLSFSWSEATDDTSAQGALTYSVYYAASGTDLSDVAAAEANGTLAQTTADISSATISGLTGETTYALQVVVRDEAGNKAAYTATTGATGLIPDVTPPVPGSSGGMVKTSSTSTSLSIRIATSSDDETEQGSIVYKLYRAPSGTDLSTIELTEASGTLVDTLTGEVDFEATGLTSNTIYVFNAIAQDASGNKALYDQTEFTTDNPLTQRPTYPTRTSVLINGGAECTSSRDVTITVDGTNVDRIVFANNQRFLGSVWELFSGSPMQKTWTLLEQEGEQSIYVVFRSWHGNKSYIHEQTIAYEPSNPDCGAIAVNTEVEEEETVTETETTTDTTTETTPEVPLTPTIEEEEPVVTAPEESVPEPTQPEPEPVAPEPTTDAQENNLELLEDYLSRSMIVSYGSKFALRLEDGRMYKFDDKFSIQTWAIAGVPAVKSTRSEWVSYELQPETIGPLPGSVIVNFDNNYYWLEDGGGPTRVVARMIDKALLEQIFGRAWKKYVYNASASTAATYVLGEPIISASDLGVDPTTLKDVRAIGRTQLPK